MPTELYVNAPESPDDDQPIKRVRFLSFQETRTHPQLRFRYHHPLPLPYGVAPLAQTKPDERGRVQVIWSDGVLEQRDQAVPCIPTMSWPWISHLAALRLPPETHAGIRAVEEQRLRERIVDNAAGNEDRYALPVFEPDKDGAVTPSGQYQKFKNWEGRKRVYSLRGADLSDIPDSGGLTQEQFVADTRTIRVGLRSHSHYDQPGSIRRSVQFTLPDNEISSLIDEYDPAPGVYGLVGLLVREVIVERDPSIAWVAKALADLTGGAVEAHHEDFNYHCTVDVQMASRLDLRWLTSTQQLVLDRINASAPA